MKLVIDTLGSDQGYTMAVEGTLSAMEKDNFDVVFCGPKEEIEKIVNKSSIDKNRIEYIDTDEYISNEEDPVRSIRRKKNSTTVKGLEYINNEGADGFITAGSTGATLAGAIFIAKRLESVKRAFLGAVLPNGNKGFILADTGANAEVSPEVLFQFGIIGSAYMKALKGIENPRVGLLNIGSEEGKGSQNVKKAYDLFKDSHLNFVGNIEARDALFDTCDVLVCDGFTGNIFLKTIEGTGKLFFSLLKESFMKSVKTKLGALLVKNDLNKSLSKYNYKEYGGAPFLGVNTLIYKAHGNSDSENFEKAILELVDLVKKDVINKIKIELEENLHD